MFICNFYSKSIYVNNNGNIAILQNINTQINDYIILITEVIEQTLNKLPKYSAEPDEIPTI